MHLITLLLQVNVCLFLLSVYYLPISVSIMGALLPIVDWDTAIDVPVKKLHAYHTPCYYMAFPPQVSKSKHINSIINSSSLIWLYRD